MTTLKHSYRVTRPDGKQRLVSNKNIEFSVENPHVGEEVKDWLEEASGDEKPFFVLAWMLEHYGDEIADEIENADDEELRETVIEIERRRTEDRVRHRERQELKEEIDEMNPHEIQALKEAAGDVDVDVDEVDSHAEAVERGEE